MPPRQPHGSDVVPSLEIEPVDSKLCLACMPDIVVIKNGCWDRHTKRHRLDAQRNCSVPGCGYMSVRLEILENHLRSKHGAPMLECPVPIMHDYSGRPIRCDFSTATMQTLRSHMTHEHGVALSSYCTLEPPRHLNGTRRLIDIHRPQEFRPKSWRSVYPGSSRQALHPTKVLQIKQEDDEPVSVSVGAAPPPSTSFVFEYPRQVSKSPMIPAKTTRYQSSCKSYETTGSALHAMLCTHKLHRISPEPELCEVAALAPYPMPSKKALASNVYNLPSVPYATAPSAPLPSSFTARYLPPLARTRGDPQEVLKPLPARPHRYIYTDYD
ncbi:hypothetical protein SCP_0900550 [Sparassis crispa]|uniref:Uncharacterized protein n=1 Tax=Sparassis crispa TaxID=139825 RepID=A0A401GVC7_9APHY|nr:hypothetical protein SCP_0900550 [Sparassis crispa]GBE86178.1 hypothetical protein SCP_0900550 [Sparassis crispa]